MTFGPASDDLVALIDVVARYCARAVAPADDDTLAADLLLKRSLINRLELDFARDAARFEATYTEDEYFNPSAVSWLRENAHMTSHAAATAVCAGERAERLQLSAAALLDGRIGFAHFGWMATTARAVQESGSATAVFDERRLLAQAETLTVQRFRTVCDHLRHAADRAAFLEEQVAVREQRSLTLTAFEGGCVELTALLDPEGGAVVRTALDPLARPLGRDDLRDREQRYADALVELCAHRLDAGHIPQAASQRAHLQVTTTLETLGHLRGAPAAELEFAGLVAGHTVQRLACDATITRVLVDARSQVIDVSRSERVVPGATRRALNARDRGCRWPGCERSPSWTSAHHVVHWSERGATDTANLVLLCRHHHWCVHEGGWTLLHTEADGILALSPVVGVMTPLRDPGPVLPGTPPTLGAGVAPPGNGAALMPSGTVHRSAATPTTPRDHPHRARERRPAADVEAVAASAPRSRRIPHR